MQDFVRRFHCRVLSFVFLAGQASGESGISLSSTYIRVKIFFVENAKGTKGPCSGESLIFGGIGDMVVGKIGPDLSISGDVVS